MILLIDEGICMYKEIVKNLYDNLFVNFQAAYRTDIWRHLQISHEKRADPATKNTPVSRVARNNVRVNLLLSKLSLININRESRLSILDLRLLTLPWRYDFPTTGSGISASDNDQLINDRRVYTARARVSDCESRSRLNSDPLPP